MLVAAVGFAKPWVLSKSLQAVLKFIKAVSAIPMLNFSDN